MLKDHNAVTPVRLEPAAPWSQVKHLTTEPLRSKLHACVWMNNSFLLVVSADNLCKQFGPRSGLTKWWAWSWSKLFDTLIVFFKEIFEKWFLMQKNPHWCAFVLLDLILYVQVNNFSVMSGQFFLGWTSIQQDKCVLLKNTIR